MTTDEKGQLEIIDDDYRRCEESCGDFTATTDWATHEDCRRRCYQKYKEALSPLEEAISTRRSKVGADGHITISANMLYQEYWAENNGLRYTGHLLKVTGDFSRVQELRPRIGIWLYGGRSFGVVAFFDEKHRTRLANYPKGQALTVVGLCKGAIQHDYRNNPTIALIDCRLE